MQGGTPDSNGVHPSIDRMQESRPNPTGDGGAIQPKRPQLPDRDHATLSRCKPSDGLPDGGWAVLISIYATTTAHLARVAPWVLRVGDL
jgi:hypothetical protein